MRDIIPDQEEKDILKRYGANKSERDTWKLP